MAFENIINPIVLKKHVELWLCEDVPNFDFSLICAGSDNVVAHIEMKGKGIIAGLPFAEAVFKYTDCRVKWLCQEGSLIENKTIIAEISGSSSKLLMGERIALNILSRSSGIATVVKRVKAKVGMKWKGEFIGVSREMSPGMRLVDYHAMIVGGMRINDDVGISRVFLRENLSKVYGSVESGVSNIRERAGKLVRIDVECRSMQQAQTAAKCGAEIITLEGFSTNEIKSVSKQVKDSNPSVLVKVSGGINENNVMDYAVANVDMISSSMFCQGYKSIDLSLNIISVTAPFTSEPVAVAKTSNESVVIASIDLANNGYTSVVPVPIVVAKPSTAVVLTTSTVPILTTVDQSKVAPKRKLNEAAEKTEVNNIPAAPTESSKIDIKKPDEKATPPPPPKTPTKARMQQRKVDSGTPSKQTRLQYGGSNSVRATGNGSMSYGGGGPRMPGHPVGMETGRVAGPGMIRSMQGASTYPQAHAHSQPAQQPSNDTSGFFRGSVPLRYGGAPSRLLSDTLISMGDANGVNARFFCRACRFQNPSSGPPACRLCRRMLF